MMNEQSNPYGYGNEPDYIRVEDSKDELSRLLYRWGVEPGEVKTIWKPHEKKFFLMELKDRLKKNVSFVDHKKKLQADGFIFLEWDNISDPAIIHCCKNKSYAIRPYNIHLTMDMEYNPLGAITNWLQEKLEFEPLFNGSPRLDKRKEKERLLLTKDTYDPLYFLAYHSKMQKVQYEMQRRIDNGATSLLLTKQF